MPNNQYVATVLEGKCRLEGNRKIKATKTSLDSILKAAQKIGETINKKANSFIDKLKEKNIILYKIGEVGTADSTGRKAINVSSSMRQAEENYAKKIETEQGLEEQSFVKSLEKSSVNENVEDPTNADTIINALHIFENTNNLEANDSQKDPIDENPPYMQVSGKIAKESQENIDGSLETPEEPKFEIPQSEQMEPKSMIPSHEGSGYLDDINAFKAQIGTNKFEDPSNSLPISTNADLKVKNTINPVSETSIRNSSAQNLNIDEFVNGYVSLDGLSVSELKSYKAGCDEYVAAADANMNQLSAEMNDIDAQIQSLQMIRQTKQAEYNDAKLKKANGLIKFTDIDNEFDRRMADLQSAMSDTNYGRGRAA